MFIKHEGGFDVLSSAQGHLTTKNKIKINMYIYVGERVGELREAGWKHEESQVRGCYNMTFISTNQETVWALS